VLWGHEVTGKTMSIGTVHLVGENLLETFSPILKVPSLCMIETIRNSARPVTWDELIRRDQSLKLIKQIPEQMESPLVKVAP
jgi:hypothetical protein